MSTFCLVYKSTATKTFEHEDIKNMLNKARANNLQNGITGCLLFHDGEFIQYLEGNQLKVLCLFDKIKEDYRHHHIELLAHGEREGREFSDWEMAFEDFYGDNDQINYLRLLVTSYRKNPDSSLHPNPSVNSFWIAVKENLDKTLESNF